MKLTPEINNLNKYRFEQYAFVYVSAAASAATSCHVHSLVHDERCCFTLW